MTAFVVAAATNRIMERAYALRDSRERKRIDQVTVAMDKQWRDACDDARTLDSEALLLYVNRERLAQIDEKIKRKQSLSAEEQKYNSEWRRQLDEQEARDRAKSDRHVHAELDNERKLALQIQDNSAKKKAILTAQKRVDDQEIAEVCFEGHFLLAYLLCTLLKSSLSTLLRFKMRCGKKKICSAAATRRPTSAGKRCMP